MKPQRQLSVGIFSAPQVAFRLLQPCSVAGKRYEGAWRAEFREGRILFDGALHDELIFTPCPAAAPDLPFAPASFVLSDVTIGVDFHWQRKEAQRFAGALKLMVEGDRLTAVNLIGIEDYLRCVIASEMKATASPEFLKAHAVISRSWLLAQIERRLAAKYRCGYVPDMQCSITPKGRRDLWSDSNHPNAKGNRIVADTILPELRKLLVRER